MDYSPRQRFGQVDMMTSWEEEADKFEKASLWGKFRISGYSPFCLLFNLQWPGWVWDNRFLGGWLYIIHEFTCPDTAIEKWKFLIMRRDK